MYGFCIGAFFTGIVILTVAAAFGALGNMMPLAIWTAGMAIGVLASKPSA